MYLLHPLRLHKGRGIGDGLTSFVLGVLSTIIHYANSHMQGFFCVMPAVAKLFENVLLGCTWMAATKCTIDWATNKVIMVTPSCPTGFHCIECSLQKLSRGPFGVSLPKARSQTNS